MLAKEQELLCSADAMGDTSGFGETRSLEETGEIPDTHFTGEFEEGGHASLCIGDAAGCLEDVEWFGEGWMEVGL